MTEVERLKAILEAKGPPPDCPVCGPTIWRTVSETATLAASQPQDSEGNPTRGFEVLLVECTNCGFQRMHRATVLRGEDE